MYEIHVLFFDDFLASVTKETCQAVISYLFETSGTAYVSYLVERSDHFGDVPLQAIHTWRRLR
jgi:hypothetical protein